MNDPHVFKIRSKEEIMEALAVLYLLLEHPCGDPEQDRSAQKITDVLLWVSGDEEGPFAKFMSKAGPKLRQAVENFSEEMEANE